MSTLQSENLSAREQGLHSPASDGIRHWLESSAAALRARNALVLVRQGERGFIFASFPETDKPDSVLSEVAHEAIRDGQKILRGSDRDGAGWIVVGLRSRIGGRPAAIVFRLEEVQELKDIVVISRVRRAALRRDDDDTQTFQTLPMGAVTSLINPKLDPVQSASVVAQPGSIGDHSLGDQVKEQGIALDAVAGVLDQKNTHQSARAFTDTLAKRFSCTRVTLGLIERGRTVIIASSGSANLDAASKQNLDVTLALEETILSGTCLTAPMTETGKPIGPNHRAYLDSVECAAIVSIPLVNSDDVVGAVMLECDEPLGDDDIDHLAHLALLAAPILVLKQEAAAGVLARGIKSIRTLASSVLGPSKLGLKFGLLTALGCIVATTQITRTFTIDGSASIAATVQRAVVAGSKGYVSQVEKRAGDVVYQGDVLARLDVEEVQLELIKWKGERDKLSKEQRAVLAQRDRSKIRVLSAKYAQAQAQVEYLQAQISRAVMRSPIDGVVVSGDLSEALGSPVERGQMLFEVAALDGYQLVLMVDEKDIGSVKEGYKGKLRLKSNPSSVFEFSVTRITPVAQAREGANQFQLEAEFVGVPPDVRPGMEGIAKINSGERSLAWIWTRTFVNWVRLQAWKWGGL